MIFVILSWIFSLFIINIIIYEIILNSFDFDSEIQDLLNKKFSNIKPLNWKSWFEIGSKEEYEEIALELSGLFSIENVLERIKDEKTDSRSFSIDLNSFLKYLAG